MNILFVIIIVGQFGESLSFDRVSTGFRAIDEMSKKLAWGKILPIDSKKRKYQRFFHPSFLLLLLLMLNGEPLNTISCFVCCLVFFGFRCWLSSKNATRKRDRKKHTRFWGKIWQSSMKSQYKELFIFETKGEK